VQVLSLDRSRLNTHTDKARSHNSKAFEEGIQASKAGCFPFGYIGEKLPDVTCTSQKELRSTIAEILDVIDEVRYQSVFNVGDAGETA
jgi:hypothetical protein